MKLKLKEYRRIPEQELLDDLIAVSKKLGQLTFTMFEYLENGKFHPRTLQYRFGSWYNAMIQAGLKPCRQPVALQQDQLFDNLWRVWRTLRKQPAFKDMKRPLSEYVGTSYVNHFGSWMNALRKFVEHENSRPAGKRRGRKPLILMPETKKDKDKKTKRSPRGIPLYLRYGVFIRDGFRCQACGRSPLTEPGVKLHCDHIDPWSNGGERVLDNLQTLCAECNIGKGNRLYPAAVQVRGGTGPTK